MRRQATSASRPGHPTADALPIQASSIPPEKLLRAQLIQMLYSVRSERLLMEEIDYSVLFRWFVG
jgi:transposase